LRRDDVPINEAEGSGQRREPTVDDREGATGCELDLVLWRDRAVAAGRRCELDVRARESQQRHDVEEVTASEDLLRSCRRGHRDRRREERKRESDKTGEGDSLAHGTVAERRPAAFLKFGRVHAGGGERQGPPHSQHAAASLMRRTRSAAAVSAVVAGKPAARSEVTKSRCDRPRR
jgi:hypothetical protein